MLYVVDRLRCSCPLTSFLCLSLLALTHLARLSLAHSRLPPPPWLLYLPPRRHTSSACSHQHTLPSLSLVYAFRIRHSCFTISSPHAPSLRCVVTPFFPRKKCRTG
ncbi:hypothetical protein H4582DRAFT_973292 [Lactarius indigo]|nr:hypothetical protein H4582DRAFT_973292 [Lactarius indigo]